MPDIPADPRGNPTCPACGGKIAEIVESQVKAIMEQAAVDGMSQPNPEPGLVESRIGAHECQPYGCHHQIMMVADVIKDGGGFDSLFERGVEDVARSVGEHIKALEAENAKAKRLIGEIISHMRHDCPPKVSCTQCGLVNEVRALASSRITETSDA